MDSKDKFLKYITSGKFVDLSKVDSISPIKKLNFGSRIEPRTRKSDLTDALRFRVYDPLWMLTRQWQLGEFRGNSAGTALSVKYTIAQEQCDTDPIEPITEQINPAIDPLARVQSASYYIDMLRMNGMPMEEIHQTVEKLRKSYPIQWEQQEYMLERNKADSQCNETLDEIKSFETKQNRRLQKFRKSCEQHAFDGYKLYESLKSKKKRDKIEECYLTWFHKNYLPTSDENDHWDDKALNYTIDVQTGNMHLKGDRYQGGRLSWHTLDYVKGNNVAKPITETFSALPSLATYAGAPNKRLWQFEDKKVFMGNSSEQQSKGNEVFMKYATMYGNDWMLIPVQTKIGRYISVKEIEVKDTFGDTPLTITERQRAGALDTNLAAEEPWQMFTNSKYKDRSGKSLNGLFYAPQLATTIEGNPIEEIYLLRDEMANMVWGVETKISDGAGSTLDESQQAVDLATKVAEVIDANRPEESHDKVQFGQDGTVQTITEKEGAKHADFKYQLQTHVPYNWIPFLAQHIGKDNIFLLGGRETILRRGKMPCYVLEKEQGWQLYAVRPKSTLLRRGIADGKEAPLYLNEEEIQQTGIRVTKNYQRARWLCGKPYNWLGVHKKLTKTEKGSGLEFDTLSEN